MLIQSLPIENSSPADTGIDGRGPAPADVPHGQEAFSNRFVSAMEAIATGQNLAAGALTLKTQALGPHFELVTSQGDQPDSASLAAFAKAQGLDPQVVAWLFGPAADADSKVRTQAENVDASATPTTDSLLVAGLGLPLVPPTLTTAASASGAAGAATAGAASSASISALGPNAAPGASAGAQSARAALEAGAMTLGAGPTAVTPQAGMAGALAAHQAPTQRPGADLAALNASGPASAGASAAAGTPLPPAMASAPTAGSPMTSDALPLGAASGAGLVWAMAMAEGRAQDDPNGTQPSGPDADAISLTGIRGATGTSFASQVQVQTPDAPASDPLPSTSSAQEIPVETISLEIAPELEQALSRAEDFEPLATDATQPAETPLGGMSAREASGASSTQGAPGAKASEPQAQPGTRPNGFQELADKLGQAVAQRLINQIQKGNWQMRLTLKPVTLGEVEVDLRMRSGELDAAFRSMNPATRELLNDGLPRLRETLGNAGMDIAGLHVGVGQHSRNGGNSTPQQALAPASGNAAAASPMIADAPAARVDRRPAQGQGWDVLV